MTREDLLKELDQSLVTLPLDHYKSLFVDQEPSTETFESAPLQVDQIHRLSPEKQQALTQLFAVYQGYFTMKQALDNQKNNTSLPPKSIVGIRRSKINDLNGMVVTLSDGNDYLHILNQSFSPFGSETVNQNMKQILLNNKNKEQLTQEMTTILNDQTTYNQLLTDLQNPQSESYSKTKEYFTNALIKHTRGEISAVSDIKVDNNTIFITTDKGQIYKQEQ